MEQQTKTDLLLYDWLSWTDKEVGDPFEVVELLGMGHCSWEVIKGARGYQDRLYYDCISIHYNGRDDMGIWVEMSGQGCRAYETYSANGWPYLFEYILTHNCHMTRLDVAFDDHSGLLPLPQILEDTRHGEYVSKSDYWEVIESKNGSTVQIGSSKSLLLVRIYDKAKERGLTDGSHWVRCEMQLRDERAAAFARLGQEIGTAFAGVLTNYLRYVDDPGTDGNRWRWQMKDYWERFLHGAERIRLYSEPGVDYNFKRLKNYVVGQAGAAADAYVRIVGIEEFLFQLSNKRGNPKYERIVGMMEGKAAGNDGIGAAARDK